MKLATPINNFLRVNIFSKIVRFISNSIIKCLGFGLRVNESVFLNLSFSPKLLDYLESSKMNQ